LTAGVPEPFIVVYILFYNAAPPPSRMQRDVSGASARSRRGSERERAHRQIYEQGREKEYRGRQRGQSGKVSPSMANTARMVVDAYS
jgi:hypothetical protein